MRLKSIIKIFSFGMVAFVAGACLNGDPMNEPPGTQSPFLMMTNNASGAANNPISGLRYFGDQTLSFPHSDLKDTVTFFATLQGTTVASKDIAITLTNPASALKDNYATDSLNYEMMPDSLFHLLTTSGVIKKGSDYVKFQVVFYPSKFNQTKNYMLPISVTNDANIPVAANYGTLYYHVVGNPLAGSYRWKYSRWNSSDTTKAKSGTASGTMVWAPDNGIQLQFLGGYAKTVGINAPYILTFSQSGSGVLSNFKVKIDPTLKGGLSDSGITIIQDPAILKMSNTPSGRYFKIWYRVNNGTADRTLIDEYWYP